MREYRSENSEQYFPTYDFLSDDNRDIALAEYHSSTMFLQDQEKFYTSTTNVAILALSLVGSVFIGTNNLDVYRYTQDYYGLLIFFLCNFLLASMFILYFSQKQKEIVYAARKVVTLRRLLGVSYGRIHMVLPTWRVEGADEPYAIKFFKRQTNYIHFPAYLILVCSAFLFSMSLLPHFSFEKVVFLGAVHFFYVWYLYRSSLYEDYENILLLLSRCVAKFLRISIVNNFEFVIYRAKLQSFEVNRLNVNLSNFYSSVIFLEDKTFFKHWGLSIRGIARAVVQYFRYNKISGGSTITQQLVRTLFIEDYSSAWKRKVLEVFLSLWAESVFLKQDIITMHLGAVRFEKNCNGILDAMKFFFGKIKEEPSIAEAFFLIERISNIHSKFLSNKVLVNIVRAYKAQVLTEKDALELITIYETQIKNKKIKTHSTKDFKEFQNKFHRILAKGN